MGSPRLGSIADRVDPEKQAALYGAGGAAALSVVTEPDFFFGSYDLLRRCKAASGLPAIAKDFLVCESQIEQAAEAGADAFLLIASLFSAEELRGWAGAVRAHGLAPLARVTAYAIGGGEPRDLFFAPVHAVRSLLSKARTSIGDYDLIEANEAFAVQAIADGRELGWDWDRVNVHGGAVALGHPIGASGARVLTTLLYALQDRGASTGLATLCLGGGNAVALSVERI